MVKGLRTLLAAVLGTALFSTAALAYINPGTGMAIIGSIWPLALAIFLAISAFVVKHFWKPIKSIFSR